MRRVTLACACCALLVHPVRAQVARTPSRTPPANAPAKLPVRRVVLFKNGVGYFEHLGHVRGTQTLSIDFNTAQLDDVLKSLTTVDLGSGRIADVSFTSEAPLARRLGALALPLGERPTTIDLIGALRGARLECRTGTGAVIVGRVLGVERRTGVKDAPPHDEITLVSDDGTVRTVELTPAVAIKLADPDTAGQVAAYLGLLSSTRARNRRTMTIAAVGSGARDVLVGYVSEVPVWKTTYRLVLPADGAGTPRLQGWAIVDNTIGEDWSGVELSLVAGAPQSFVQPLSQPVYAQRPVIAINRAMTPAPQVHQETLQVSGETGVGRRLPLDAASGPVRVGGNVNGGVVAPPPAAPRAIDRAVVEQHVADMAAAAQAQAVGDLFEYRVNGPITIRTNESALVPIVAAPIAVERVSVWNDRMAAGRPLRSVWLTNTTGLTLDGGSFTVLDAATYAGEGLIEPIKPGEKRLLSYAVDLGIQVESRHGDDSERVSRIRIDRGIAVVQREQRSRRVYTIRNNDATPRSVVVEHPIRTGWTLAGGVTPAETSRTAYRFAVQVAAKDTTTLTVEERQPLDTEYRVAELSDEQIALFVTGKRGDPTLAAALEPIQAMKTDVAAIAAELEERRHATAELAKDQERLRENMRALKGGADERRLLGRYVAQLDRQEDQIAALRKDAATLETRLARARAELAALVERLSVDLEIADGPAFR